MHPASPLGGGGQGIVPGPNRDRDGIHRRHDRLGVRRDGTGPHEPGTDLGLHFSREDNLAERLRI